MSARYENIEPVAAPPIPSSMGEAIGRCFSLYSQSSGRASRPEFWYWRLFVALTFGIPFAVLSMLMDAGADEFVIVILELPLLLWALVLLLPTINVEVRRLHDCDRSGCWRSLLLFGPLAPFFLVAMGVAKGTRGTNKYGPEPVKLR